MYVYGIFSFYTSVKNDKNVSASVLRVIYIWHGRYLPVAGLSFPKNFFAARFISHRNERGGV